MPGMVRLAPIILILVIVGQPAALVGQEETDRPDGKVDERRRISLLISDLGAEKFSVRQQASRVLERIGVLALSELQEATTSKDSETRYRAQLILKRIERQLAVELRNRLRQIGGDYEEDDSGRLIAVNARNTRFADADVAKIVVFKWLQSIDLRHTLVSDQSLVPLAAMPNLRRLHLSHTAVSDDSLARLRTMTQLEEISLSFTDVTDAGIEHLAALPQLQVLRLWNTRITDKGLAHLAGNTQIKQLDLCDTAVTDQGLVHLAELTALEKLNLVGTRVTDEGLLSLEGLSRLEDVRLSGTKVTVAGVQRLQSKLDKSMIVNVPMRPVESSATVD